MTEELFGKGGHISPPDERDYKWSELPVGKASIPFNWDLGYEVKVQPKKTKNQNGSYSCGGQATAYHLEVIEAVATGTQEERSAKFVYAQTAVPSGGSVMRENMNLACKQGVAEESVLPSYENGNPPSEAFMTRKEDITDEVRANAAPSKAKIYSYVNPKDIDEVAQAIANNYGCQILIQGKNNGTWLTAFPAVTTPGDTWNHFLYAGKAKKIKGARYIGCKNSWGDVGDDGWQWIHEDFFKNGYILECRTITFTDKPIQFQFTKDLRFGMRNADVLQLQHRLIKEGYGNYEPTGYFGAKTLASVIAYQKAHNISPVRGYVGELTRAALNK